MTLITSCPLVLPVITGANTPFLHPDSGPPPLKSKSKQLPASSSPPTTPEVSTCTPTPTIQTDPTPSTPAPSTPVSDHHEPGQVETTSADDDDAPQTDENMSQEVKNDTAEVRGHFCFSQNCCPPVNAVCEMVACFKMVYFNRISEYKIYLNRPKRMRASRLVLFGLGVKAF